MEPTYLDPGRVAQLLRGGSWNNNITLCVVCLPQHPSPSEPLERIPAGALEESRPAPEIGRSRPLIRTAPCFSPRP